MFAGIISKEQQVSAWGDADKILAALAPNSLDKPRDHWATDKLLLLQVATRIGSISAEIYQHPESGAAVAFWGRLDNRPDLIAQLEAKNKASDDELIALAWLKWGEQCPEKLIGDFAFAVASPKTGVVFLVRDVIGVKPLFYRVDNNGVFFANSAAAFKPLKIGTLTHSQEWMARYMLDMTFSHTDTAFEEIKKLPGAHSLLIHADGRMNKRRYHQFIEDAPMENKRDPKYLEAYRAAWQEAVACRIPESGNFGTENSGGLDSGSITAEVARQLGGDVDRLHTFGCSHISSEPGFIMSTAMKWKIKNNILFAHERSKYAFELSERMLRFNGYPLEYDENIYTYPTYQSCVTHGIGTLFSGLGGDQAITQYNVSVIRTEFIDQKQWQTLWRVLPGSIPAKMARFIKNVYAASKSTATYREGWVNTRKAIWQSQFLNKEVILKFNLEAINSAAASYDEGVRRISQLAIKLLATPYVTTRLENCSLESSSFGIEYVWPMLDQRLIQQWLSTPTIWKINDGGLSRYLHRKAIAGVSADMVTWLPTKDMGGVILDSESSSSELQAKLKNLIESLNAKQSSLLSLIDSNKAMQFSRASVDGPFDYYLELNMNRLNILDLWG